MGVACLHAMPFQDLHKESWVFLPVQTVDQEDQVDQVVRSPIVAELPVAFLVELLGVPMIGYHL